MSYPAVVQFSRPRNTMFTAKRPRLIDAENNDVNIRDSTILGASNVIPREETITGSVIVGPTTSVRDGNEVNDGPVETNNIFTYVNAQRVGSTILNDIYDNAANPQRVGTFVCDRSAIIGDIDLSNGGQYDSNLSQVIGSTSTMNDAADIKLEVNNSSVLANFPNTKSLSIQDSVIVGNPGERDDEDDEVKECLLSRVNLQNTVLIGTARSNADLPYINSGSYSVNEDTDSIQRDDSTVDPLVGNNRIVLGNSGTTSVVLMGSRPIELDMQTGAQLTTPILQQHQEFMLSTAANDLRIPASIYTTVDTGDNTGRNSIHHLSFELYPPVDTEDNRRVKAVPEIIAQFPLIQTTNEASIPNDNVYPLYIESADISITARGVSNNNFTSLVEINNTNNISVDIMILPESSTAFLNVRTREAAIILCKLMHMITISTTVSGIERTYCLNYPTISPQGIDASPVTLTLQTEPITQTWPAYAIRTGFVVGTGPTVSFERACQLIRNPSTGEMRFVVPITEITADFPTTSSSLTLTPTFQDARLIPVRFETRIPVPCPLLTNDLYECTAEIIRGTDDNDVMQLVISWGMIPQSSFQAGITSVSFTFYGNN
jgi:hypothetical protein